MISICKFAQLEILTGCLARVAATRVSSCKFSESNNDNKGSDDDGKKSDDSGYNSCTMYECRKYGHCLPSNNVLTCFEPLYGIPTGVFRNTTGELLGPGANKCAYYRNPEYFSYHHMTYYDIHLILRPCRGPSPNTGRKP